MVVHVLLAHQSMSPHAKSMVSGEYNDCIIFFSRFFQGFQNTGYLSIHVSDDRIVFLKVNLNGERRPWEWCEELIA